MFLGVRATIRDMQLRGEEIKYKISHPDCCECNLRKTTGYYDEEEDVEEDAEEETEYSSFCKDILNHARRSAESVYAGYEENSNMTSKISQNGIDQLQRILREAVEVEDDEPKAEDDLMKIFEIANSKRPPYDPLPEEQGNYTPEEVIEIAKRVYHMAKKSKNRK